MAIDDGRRGSRYRCLAGCHRGGLRVAGGLFGLGIEHRGSDGDRGRDRHPAARAAGWRFDHVQQLTFVGGPLEPSSPQENGSQAAYLVGAGVASADRSTRGHSHSHHRVHRNVGSGADTDSQELLPPDLANLKNDPNRRKQLMDLIRNTVVHN